MRETLGSAEGQTLEAGWSRLELQLHQGWATEGQESKAIFPLWVKLCQSAKDWQVALSLFI